MGKPKEPRPRRTHLTGRAAILAVVVCAVVLSLAYPVREYLAQQSRIAELRADNQELQHEISTLQEKKRKLNDPAYIKELARERLHFTMPGQTNHIVVDGGDEGDVAPDTTTEAEQHPWFVNLWDSVEEANQGGQA